MVNFKKQVFVGTLRGVGWEGGGWVGGGGGGGWGVGVGGWGWWLGGYKTIPGEALLPSLESIYPPWVVADIDLPQSRCCGFFVTFTYKMIINSAKRRGTCFHLRWFVCLFVVCLSVDNITEKTRKRIFMKLSRQDGHDTRNKLEIWGNITFLEFRVSFALFSKPCLLATIRENGWKDLHEILNNDRTWNREQLGTFSGCCGYLFESSVDCSISLICVFSNVMEKWVNVFSLHFKKCQVRPEKRLSRLFHACLDRFPVFHLGAAVCQLATLQ